MNWYRVQVVGGAAISASLVDAEGSEEAGVVYVLADDEQAALRSAAMSWLGKWGQRRRDELKAANKCTRCAVPKPPGEPGFRCARCARVECVREKMKREASRSDAPKLPRSRIHLERRAILLEVREAWLNAQVIGEFTAWLADELTSLGITNGEEADKLLVAAE